MSTTATTPAPASKPPEEKHQQLQQERQPASTAGILDVLLHSRSKSEPMLRSATPSPTISDHARTITPPPPPMSSSASINSSASLIPTPLADAATSSAQGTPSSTQSSSSQPTAASIIKHYPTSTPKKPEDKINFACTCCRRAHKACDGFRPCGRCVRLGLEEQCRNSVRKKRGSLSVNKKSMWRKLLTQQGNANTPPVSASPSPTQMGETSNQAASTSTTPKVPNQADKMKVTMKISSAHLACSPGIRPHEKTATMQLSTSTAASVSSSSTAPSTKSNSGCSTDPKRLPSIQEIFGVQSTVPSIPPQQTYYPFWVSASASFFNQQQQPSMKAQQQPAAPAVRSVLDFSRQSTPFFSFANQAPPKTTPVAQKEENKTIATSRVSAP